MIKLLEANKEICTYKNDYEFIRATQTTYFNEWECESDLWMTQLQYTKIPITIQQCKIFLEAYCDKQVEII